MILVIAQMMNKGLHLLLGAEKLSEGGVYLPGVDVWEMSQPSHNKNVEGKSCPHVLENETGKPCGKIAQNKGRGS